MNFAYSQDQESIRRLVREFATEEIAPGAQNRDETGQFDYELYKRLGDLGLIGLSLPSEYGGGGQDMLSFCLVLEEIARADMSLSWAMLVSMASAHTVISAGSDEQIEMWEKDWVTGIISGRKTGSTGITEPEAGSDASRIKTSAVPKDGNWIINGKKSFITAAGLENSAGVLAVCALEGQSTNFGSILIPMGAPGYNIKERYGKMGLCSSDTRPLEFNDCTVPENHLISSKGDGMKDTLTNLFVGRILLSSTALGLAEACLDEASNYAKSRFAFKRPIAEFQYIQGMLTEMALNVELSRIIRDKAAWLFENGKPFFREAAMTKWFACETAKKNADYAVQIFGGQGYMNCCPVSRFYRDARATTIAEGTTEIQRHVIAREMGLLGI